jgi:ubiquinone/menaquinone biosynthesis C-methylase UbiE
MDPTDPAYAGQHFYSPWFLRIYDPLVLGLFAHVVWRCPTRRLVQHYTQNLGQRHMDVGPGTGYFLEHARLPASASVLLVDPNPDVLTHASRRLAHLNPSLLQADVCKPLPVERRFDSIAINYVLHCLRGPMLRRSAAVHNLAALLEPEGALFGATVLGTPELHTWLSRAALRENNRRGIFDNLHDTEGDLREVLTGSFATVDIDIVGSVAVFTVANPRT